MNSTLLKLTAKKNMGLFWVILCVMVFYALVIVGMYDPDNIEAVESMFELMPAEMISAFGFSGSIATLIGFMASWLYGFILTAFPLIYSIILCNRLVSKTVDDGSVVCLLSSPCSRAKIIFTKAKYASISLFTMHLIVFFVNILGAKLLFDQQLPMKEYINLNLALVLLNICAMSICFVCSCIFSDNKKSVAVGTFITVGQFVLNMLGNVSSKSEFLKNYSIYGVFNPEAIAQGESVVMICIVYASISIILFASGILIFNRKNLSV